MKIVAVGGVRIAEIAYGTGTLPTGRQVPVPYKGKRVNHAKRICKDGKELLRIMTI